MTELLNTQDFKAKNNSFMVKNNLQIESGKQNLWGWIQTKILFFILINSF